MKDAKNMKPVILRLITFIFIILFSFVIGIMVEISQMDHKLKDLFLNAWIFSVNYWLMLVQVEWVEKMFKKYHKEV